LSDPSNLEEEGGNKEDFSFGVYGAIGVSEVDWLWKPFGGDTILPDKSSINTGDISS